jgi:hypothetical protein
MLDDDQPRWVEPSLFDQVNERHIRVTTRGRTPTPKTRSVV